MRLRYSRLARTMSRASPFGIADETTGTIRLPYNMRPTVGGRVSGIFRGSTGAVKLYLGVGCCRRTLQS